MSTEPRNKPTVLVVATSRWLPTARLATALADAGFVVHAVCPSAHPMRFNRAQNRTFTYWGLLPLQSIKRAIVATEPDLIVPGDDLSVQHILELYEQLRRAGQQELVCGIIERSFGSPSSLRIATERGAFIRLAQEQGIRVPETEPLLSIEHLKEWCERVGFPCVLKANGTSGGEGVIKVHSLTEAERAFHRLQAPPLLARAAKRALVDRDKTLLRSSVLRSRTVVNAQKFIEGTEATSLVACWQGRVLAGLHFEVIQKKSDAGPATVLRLIDNAEMSTAAERAVHRLGLSGLHGFDYMLESETGHAYLIEINPRATQIGHLTLGSGRDLPAAVYSAMTGETLCPRRKITEQTTFALFPNEWLRDPDSSYLRSAYHDVPWEQPEVVRFWIGKSLDKQSSMYQKGWRELLNIAGSPQPRAGLSSQPTELLGSLVTCTRAKDKTF